MAIFKRFFLPLLYIALIVSSAFSLELKEGRIKLVLHEGIGRFSLYYLDISEESKFLPFFLDEDCRTSGLSLVIGNRIYRIGEAASFKEIFENTESGARFTWISKSLQVTEEFSFVSSKGSSLADGIKITLKMSNISDRSLQVGVRYLFDTYLGEDSPVHFKTDLGEKVEKEMSFTKSNVPDYWISVKENDEEDAVIQDTGLQVVTRGAQVTVPDNVIFANWKRLNDASWTYETSTSRNFNMLPYSINDSAVCHYYDPASIAAGSSRTITLLMGNISPEGFESLSSLSSGNLSYILEKATKTGDDTALTIKSDLQSLDALLSEINIKIENQTISESDLALIKKVVEELKKKYSLE